MKYTRKRSLICVSAIFYCSLTACLLLCFFPPTSHGTVHTSRSVAGEESSSSAQSQSDSWITEELWPKGKSLIHVKLIKPRPKRIEIRESRNKDKYLLDSSLDFDSYYKTLTVNNCVVQYKSLRDSPVSVNSNNNNQEISTQSSSIQVQITGGSACRHLPLSVLTPIAINLTHVVVRDTSVELLDKFIFGRARLDRLTRLDIIGNQQLSKIQKRAFDGLSRLTYLSIIDNQGLESLDPEAFAGIKSLEELIYIRNGVKWGHDAFSSIVKASSARILPNLIHVHLCGHSIDTHGVTTGTNKEKDYNWSSYNTSHVHHNNGSEVESMKTPSYKPEWSSIKIGKDEFVNLVQVKYLQLTDCDITGIHPLSFLPMLPNLNSLNLSENPKITMGNLKEIIPIFSHSTLRAVKAQLGGNATEDQEFFGLEKLDLSFSVSTAQIPKDLLTVISKTTVKELYFKKVMWTSIKVGDIPPMPTLKVLHIDLNRIDYIQEGAFAGLEELVHLSLQGNLLKEINLYIFEPLTKLRYLDLSGEKERAERETEQAVTIPRKAFIYTTSLRELNLSYKKIVTIPRNIFIGLFKLEKLHIRGCDLQSIEYLTFFPLKSIKFIDFSENPLLIQSVRNSSEDTFVGLEAVQTVVMSHNALTSSDIRGPKLFRRMHEHLQSLDLSFNYIQSVDSFMFARFAELRQLDLSHNQLVSWNNYTIFGKNVLLNQVDLSSNKITHITAEMLGDFRRLQNFSFANNPLECECEWEGPLLLLDHHQQRLSPIHDQQNLEELAHRQQQIVSTAFSSSPSEALPKSITEWLNTTKMHFLNDHHPLRSDKYYFCHRKEKGKLIKTPFKTFFNKECINGERIRRRRISLTLVSIIASVILLLTVVMLIIAFVYHSTLRTLFTMVDDDFLHNYQYDAFVSYNVNDSDWVFKQLIPSLENFPHEQHGVQTDENDKSLQKTQIRLCVYDRDFIAGRPISECITESIRDSRKVILVISNNFAQSPWCRFETDLAHNTLMDQNREGLILVKLEEICLENLEKIAPQLHFLLKTRIYLNWSEDKREQEIFWKKLRHALGFSKSGPYGTVRQYYKNYVHVHKRERNHDRRHSVVLLPTKDHERNKNDTIGKFSLNANNSSNDMKRDKEFSVKLTKEAVFLNVSEKVSQQRPNPDTHHQPLDIEENFNERVDDKLKKLEEFIVNKCAELSLLDSSSQKDVCQSIDSATSQEENDLVDKEERSEQKDDVKRGYFNCDLVEPLGSEQGFKESNQEFEENLEVTTANEAKMQENQGLKGKTIPNCSYQRNSWKKNFRRKGRGGGPSNVRMGQSDNHTGKTLDPSEDCEHRSGEDQVNKKCQMGKSRKHQNFEACCVFRD